MHDVWRWWPFRPIPSLQGRIHFRSGSMRMSRDCDLIKQGLSVKNMPSSDSGGTRRGWAARTSTSTSWGSSPGRQVHVVRPLLAAACYTLPSSMAIKSLGICNWQGARHGQMETGQCSFIRSYMGWNSFAFIFFSAFFFLPRLRSSTTCQWARALGRRRPGVRAECLGQRAMHIR